MPADATLLANALRTLADDIDCEDGVAHGLIEASYCLEEQERLLLHLRERVRRLETLLAGERWPLTKEAKP